MSTTVTGPVAPTIASQRPSGENASRLLTLWESALSKESCSVPVAASQITIQDISPTAAKRRLSGVKRNVRRRGARASRLRILPGSGMAEALAGGADPGSCHTTAPGLDGDLRSSTSPRPRPEFFHRANRRPTRPRTARPPAPAPRQVVARHVPELDDGQPPIAKRLPSGE